jgi:hypothetical protein
MMAEKLVQVHWHFGATYYLVLRSEKYTRPATSNQQEASKRRYALLTLFGAL